MKTRILKSTLTALACLVTFSATSVLAATSTDTTAYSKSVDSYLQQIVAANGADNLAGNSAVIKISYQKNGQFDQASVSGAGNIELASLIHRAVNWKSFPAPIGTDNITIIVAVNPTGTLNIAVQ